LLGSLAAKESWALNHLREDGMANAAPGLGDIYLKLTGVDSHVEIAATTCGEQQHGRRRLYRWRTPSSYKDIRVRGGEIGDAYSHRIRRSNIGLWMNQIGVLAALRPHERVLVLLQLLGGQRRLELARSAIEAVE
jgi:hypothetical protein